MRPLPDSPLVVSLGLGVDSIAMLLGMHERGIVPDAILFADTGSEKPETYEAARVVADWLERVEWPRITVVKKVPPQAPYRSLWGYCAAGDTLPSLAFTGGETGAGQCSIAWKVEPQMAWLKAWVPAQLAWGLGRLIVTAVGYDSGDADTKRCSKAMSKVYPEGTRKWVPLRDWGWHRADCEAVIRRELGAEFEEAIGRDTPLKSACFMCPATTRAEVIDLAVDDWDLCLRALVIEYRAIHGRVRFSRPGLGISWNWRQFLEREGYLPEDWLDQAVEAGYLPEDWAAYVRRIDAERPLDERILAKAEEKEHRLGRKQHGPKFVFDKVLKAKLRERRVAWLRATKTTDRGTVPEPEANVEDQLSLGFVKIEAGKSNAYYTTTVPGRVGTRLPVVRTTA